MAASLPTAGVTALEIGDALVPLAGKTMLIGWCRRRCRIL